MLDLVPHPISHKGQILQEATQTTVKDSSLIPLSCCPPAGKRGSSIQPSVSPVLVTGSQVLNILL